MKKIVPLMVALLLFTATMVHLDSSAQEITAESYIEGTVIDSVTSEPIPNATVQFFNNPAGKITYTDEKGFYSIQVDVLKEEGYDMFFIKDGYQDQYAYALVQRGETQVVNISLEPLNCVFKGITRDNETMEPLGGVEISLYPTIPNEPFFYGKSDEEGYFEIHTSEGYFKTFAGKKDYYTMVYPEIFLEEGEVMEVEIIMVKIPTGIFGVVSSNEDGPLHDAYIWLHTEDVFISLETFSDESGYYEIRTPPGTYTIEARADDHEDMVEEVIIPEEGLIEFDIQLEKSQTSVLFGYIIELIIDILGLIY